MATHSSTLAWRIPWTEEPGGLQSMGSQRVVHDFTAKPPTGTVMNGFSDKVTLLLFRDPPPQEQSALLIQEVIGLREVLLHYFSRWPCKESAKFMPIQHPAAFQPPELLNKQDAFGSRIFRCLKNPNDLHFLKGSIVRNSRSIATQVSLTFWSTVQSRPPVDTHILRAAGIRASPLHRLRFASCLMGEVCTLKR